MQYKQYFKKIYKFTKKNNSCESIVIEFLIRVVDGSKKVNNVNSNINKDFFYNDNKLNEYFQTLNKKTRWPPPQINHAITSSIKGDNLTLLVGKHQLP